MALAGDEIPVPTSTINAMVVRNSGGEGGIRTHGGLTPTTVFETVGVRAF